MWLTLKKFTKKYMKYKKVFKKCYTSIYLSVYLQNYKFYCNFRSYFEFCIKLNSLFVLWKLWVGSKRVIVAIFVLMQSLKQYKWFKINNRQILLRSYYVIFVGHPLYARTTYLFPFVKEVIKFLAVIIQIYCNESEILKSAQIQSTQNSAEITFDIHECSRKPQLNNQIGSYMLN